MAYSGNCVVGGVKPGTLCVKCEGGCGYVLLTIRMAIVV